jgi:pilus assembly protein Flp/PilA
MQDIVDLPLKALVWIQTPRKRGVTAIEYGLIAALVAIVIVTSVTLLGTKLRTMFTTLAGKLG